MRRFMQSLMLVALAIGTSSAAHAAAVERYVSGSGSDVTGTGASGAPWKTIQYAISQAVSGDHINLMPAGGIFREAVVTKTKQLLIRTDPAASTQAEIRGSVPLTGWVQQGTSNVWSATITINFFAQGGYPGEAEPGPPIPYSYLGSGSGVQQVFEDGTPLQQCGAPWDQGDQSAWWTTGVAYYHGNPAPYPNPATTSAMTAGTFWCNLVTAAINNYIIYVYLPSGANPNSHTMEVSDKYRTVIFSADGCELSNVIVRHGSRTARSHDGALVEMDANNCIVEDCHILYGDSEGVSMGYTRTGNILRRCTIENCGALGVAGSNSYGFTIENCLIQNNNYRGFSEEWEAGGIKVVGGTAYGTIKNNDIFTNYGPGLWYDSCGTSLHQSLVQGNYLYNNRPLATYNYEGDLFIEKTTNVLVQNNVIVGSQRRGLCVAGSYTNFYNNTVDGCTGDGAANPPFTYGGAALAAITEGTACDHCNMEGNIVTGVSPSGTATVFEMEVQSGSTNMTCNYNNFYRGGGTVNFTTVTNPYTSRTSWNTATGYDGSSTTTNPSYLATSPSHWASYELGSTSGAKDVWVTGDPNVVDKAGITRPRDSGYDAGALEYDSGLMLWYPFDNNATTVTDYSKNAFNLTMNNSPTWFSNAHTYIPIATDPFSLPDPATPGRGLSVHYNGSNQYAASGTTGIPNPTSAMTFMAWFDPDSTTTANTGTEMHLSYELVCTGVSAGLASYKFTLIDANNVSHSISTSTGTTIAGWHHVAGVFNGTSISLFVDGVANGTTVTFSSTTVWTCTQPLEVGRHNTGSGYTYYKGSIDDVRLYSRALGASEIGTIMSSN